MSWINLVAFGSSITAAFIALVTGFNALRANRAREQQRQVLQELNLPKVLAGDRLNDLGDLIVVELGSTSMADYTRDDEVRKQFTVTFGQIAKYLGEDGTPPLEKAPASADIHEKDTTRSKPTNPDLAAGFDAIVGGETWNGLARTRRYLEQVLKEIHLANGLEVAERQAGAARLLGVLSRRGLVQREHVPGLRYAISVANRAIHGEDVPAEQALEALEIIDRFTAQLERTEPPF